MLEIKPVANTYPVARPAVIKKDDHPPDQRQPQKEPAAEEQEAQPVQHIDEIV